MNNKKFAIHLKRHTSREFPARRSCRGSTKKATVHFKEKATLEEVHNKKPIIKNLRIRTDEKGSNEYITYLVPVPCHNFYGYTREVRTTGKDYCEFDTVEKARKFIDHYKEIAEERKLCRKITRLENRIQGIREKATKKAGFYCRMYGIDDIIKVPREDTYGIHINDMKDRSKDTKYLAEKGVSFLLSKDEHREICAIFSEQIENIKSHNVESAIENFHDFIKDLRKFSKINKKDYFNDDVKKFLDSHELFYDFLISIKDDIIEMNKLYEEHGTVTKEDFDLPEGYRFIEKPELGEYYGYPYNGDDSLCIINKDNTIEVSFHYNRLGTGHGDVHYKIDGKGVYCFSRRGIEDGFYFTKDALNPMSELLREQIAKAEEKINKIMRSVPVTIRGRTWQVTPENIEKIKDDFKNGKSHGFYPSGMGIALTLSPKKDNLYSTGRASDDIEKLFDMIPLYVSEFEYD